ncbi:transcriptional regulator [Robbsia andropogonis]|uniref:Transcriptional regulator n=1 Tax=Robbsia andropogonis TaxID=28092 RepID=A0A0F5JSL1_9BURK|nr:hypothetical protein [Robbsia andropogonis]KKB60831.1 transcriptional regulator [Robbsia andropogonis]
MDSIVHIEIRPECLQVALEWISPRGAEVREVLRRASMTPRRAARFLGLSDLNGRQVRRWITEDTTIPYSAWALLCDAAGLGQIWRAGKEC